MMHRRAFIASVLAAAATPALPRLSLAKVGDGVFELRASVTQHALAGGDHASSDLWLYNGETPGPIIRVTQGERVRVRFVNDLAEPTSVHWHGIRIENAMDGVSGLTQQPVPPGGSFDYDFTVPDAGTFWYHAHNKSWSHVARGLYGPLIVDEPTPTFDSNRDLTLVLDDWRLGQDGALHDASLGAFMDWSHAGRLGNWMTVNGQSSPRFDLATGKAHRIRLINAANARVFQIDPSALGAKLIGLDGFVFDAPRSIDGPIAFAPAQRMDLLVQRQEQGSFALIDTGDFALQQMSEAEPVPLATFEFAGGAAKLEMAPILSPNAIAEPDIQGAMRVPLILTGGAMGRAGAMTYNGEPLTRPVMMEHQQVWAFNGAANMTTDPMFAARRGQTIIVETINRTGWAHAMHVHGHHFRVITRNGHSVENADWRDTFFIDRDETVEIAFVADNPGRWMLHCHMLEHAAAGMRNWFSVGANS
ncbi:multicopper oxidase family protein [Ahrensia sp. R2A130]|uniref:multicopper oxidase family protein n=1 Tax=Ahrensia sp. R2A130 TaxID=744979 RepID=UPI0001E0E84B|nr:multicopper oxidase family protein [Ahrensia sp. R2A130]EFL90935.1 multicopper oxidase domain-containing protein [Ahrensia sp. R2A130]